MGKNINSRKFKYRQKAVHEWEAHNTTTPELKKAFLVGFNMGWKARHRSHKGLPIK